MTFLNRKSEAPARDLSARKLFRLFGNPVVVRFNGGRALNLLRPSAPKMTVEHTRGQLKLTMSLCTCLTTDYR